MVCTQNGLDAGPLKEAIDVIPVAEGWG